MNTLNPLLSKEVKFEEMPLHVPELNKITKTLEKLSSDFINAKDSKEALRIIKKTFKLSDEINSDLTIISINFTINTLDEKIKKMQDECDEIGPKIQEVFNKFNNLVLNSKYINELKEKLGDHYINLLENENKIFSSEIIDDLIQESKLVNEYDALLASAQIEFEGETLNLSQLGKHLSDTNRERRFNAAKLYYGFLEGHDEEIGNIYDKLVHLRDGMAHKLGYKNYVELGYRKLSRLDYDSEMVSNYRKQILEVVVPEVNKLKKLQAKRIGIKNPTFLDYNLDFKEGNPRPKGNSEELVEDASKMYHEMSKETGEFFDFMVRNHLMDLDAKKGKMGGGYMTYIPRYNAPFIFSNSNGTSQDVDTLTHEFGHAFQGYLGSKISNPSLRMPTLEACEIDSMTMEFFAWPWMELFFKEDANKYRYVHLMGALTFLPYGCAIDEFQHFVYENVNATHKERCAKWREIDRKYRPYLDFKGFDYLENGGIWVRQSHVFGSPFYYIDYTLAQVLALEFKCEYEKNKEKAWKKYIKLLTLGGQYPFLTLLSKAKLRNPFIDGNVKKVVKPQLKVLNSIKID